MYLCISYPRLDSLRTLANLHNLKVQALGKVTIPLQKCSYSPYSDYSLSVKWMHQCRRVRMIRFTNNWKKSPLVLGCRCSCLKCAIWISGALYLDLYLFAFLAVPLWSVTVSPLTLQSASISLSLCSCRARRLLSASLAWLWLCGRSP